MVLILQLRISETANTKTANNEDLYVPEILKLYVWCHTKQPHIEHIFLAHFFWIYKVFHLTFLLQLFAMSFHGKFHLSLVLRCVLELHFHSWKFALAEEKKIQLNLLTFYCLFIRPFPLSTSMFTYLRAISPLKILYETFFYFTFKLPSKNGRGEGDIVHTEGQSYKISLVLNSRWVLDSFLACY